MTFPTSPISFTKNKVFTQTSAANNSYWIHVPESYDSTHLTPVTLFVWMHGCGGYSQYDIALAAPGDSTQTWIAVTPSGAEGKCWNTGADPAKVMEVIADVKKKFNINQDKVIIGGYSSGGDMSYRMCFTMSGISGALIENCSPFRDSGTTVAMANAVAKKMPIVQLCHLSDTTYPISVVRSETDALKNSGWAIERIELPGTHWDNDAPAAAPTSGTKYDMKMQLLPYLTTKPFPGAPVVTPPVVPPAPVIDLAKMRVIARGTSVWETGCCTEIDLMNYSKVNSASWSEFKVKLGTNVIRTKADGTPDVWGCTVSSKVGTVTVKPASWTKLIATGSKVAIGMATEFGNGFTSPTYVSGSLK